MAEIILVHDVEKNEVVEREMTAEEMATLKKIRDEQNAITKAAEDKAKARQTALAKLVDLGLTEEEIAAL